jgi:hypothetical protein
MLLKRDVLSGFAYSCSLTVVKFLAIIFAPILFLGARKRIAWTLGAVIPCLVVFGVFVGAHCDILQPLKQQGTLSGGASLPPLIQYVTGAPLPPRLADLITVLGLILCFLVSLPILKAVDNRRVWGVAMGLLLITCTTLALSKKSWVIYLIMVMFILCQLISRRGKVTAIIYAVLSFLMVTEPSFSETHIAMQGIPIHQLLMEGRFDGWLLILMSVAEVLSVLWLAWQAALELRHLNRTNALPPNS